MSVVWRPWPEEKPKVEDRYLIYYEEGRVRRTFIADYLPLEEVWMSMLGTVLMWAEYNKPGGQDES